MSNAASFIIVRVALFTPLRKLFDYLLPEKLFLKELENTVENTGAPEKGTRVLVPFGKQKKIGIIVDIVKESPWPIHKLKPIEAILDDSTSFSSLLFKLIHWASSYYQTAIGEVFEAALPKKLRQIPTEKSVKKTKPKQNPLLKEQINEDTKTEIKELPILNSEQAQAVNTIRQNFGKFQTFLIDGVTGSGKTEVYMRLVAEIIESGKQCLILVPEIGLTPQLLRRFQKRFQSQQKEQDQTQNQNTPLTPTRSITPVTISVLHSGLTEKKRYDAWIDAQSGVANIIIGTRSSVFVPLPALGLIIIDEEHDLSLKQQEGFRYHARDLAIIRASLEHCPIVLGTATPSLETLHNVNAGRFKRLILPVRAGNAIPPSIQVLDIRHKKLKEGLSAQLIQKIEQHLQDKGQVLIFLNRRGFAPVLICFDCGWTANCKHCDAKMTLHYQQQRLQCHHCESIQNLPKQCPNCQQNALKPLGIGTERIEAALQEIFPKYTIARIDKDTTRKKNALAETMEKIQQGEIQILLGTQMIAKGHHLPNVTLVAILEIDHALFSTDFRSLERMGQLITQVAGRAGRSNRLGEVIIQTCHPQHPLLLKLLDQGYAQFAKDLLAERRAVTLPPYSHQILIRAESKNKENANDFLNFVKTLLSKTLRSETVDLKILGPIPAPMERRIGKFRAQLLLQASERKALHKLMNEIVLQLENNTDFRSVRWSIDVDPVDMY